MLPSANIYIYKATLTRDFAVEMGILGTSHGRKSPLLPFSDAN